MIYVFLGVLLLSLGIGTLWMQLFSTLASVYLLGWIILVAGVAQFFYGITSGAVKRTLLYVITGIVSVCIGLLAVTNPALPAVTFASLIGILLLISGTYRMVSALVIKEEDWKYALTGGITSFILGSSMILTSPFPGLFVAGFFIGIELIINGSLLIIQPALLPDEERSYRTSPFLRGAKGGKAKRKPPQH